MNRFASLLCLLGLVLFLVGLYMTMRFLFPPLENGMLSISLDQRAAIQEVAAPEVLGTYLLALAAGCGVFCAGLAALLAHWRGH